jgi:tripartite-type tricarboxylate transporter receptor subunit TctC
MSISSLFKGICIGTGLALATCAAMAQINPGRAVRVVVPLPAGTATDLVGRLVIQQMSTNMAGQPFVIDNKAGANGTIGTMDMVRSAPDGNTLLVGSNSPLATNVALVKNMPYDPRKDFTPIAGFGLTMHVLMVKPTFPAKTLPEFIAYVKKNPGKISAGSSTTGVQVQIAAFNKLAGTDLLVVPYKGIPGTINDVIGGTLDVSWVDLTNALAHAKAGTLRPLAVTSLKRNPLVPDWPAVSETLPGYDFAAFVALVGPLNMPKDIVEKLNTAANQALKDPNMVEKLAGIGFAPMPATPESLKDYIRSETDKWVHNAREANVQPE